MELFLVVYLFSLRIGGGGGGGLVGFASRDVHFARKIRETFLITRHCHNENI
jgi:hypothetical protein